MRASAVRNQRPIRVRQMKMVFNELDKPQPPIVRELDFLTRQVLGNVEEKVKFEVEGKTLYTNLSSLRQMFKNRDFTGDLRALPFYEKSGTGFAWGVVGVIRVEIMKKYFLERIVAAKDVFTFAVVEMEILIFAEVFSHTAFEDLFLDLVVALVDAGTDNPSLH